MDQVAILGEFADKRIDLSQAQRGLRTALQIAAHELVLPYAQFQRRGAGLVASRSAVLLGKREHAHDAADAGLGLTMVDRIADCADVGPGFMSPCEQLMRMERCAAGAVLIPDAMATSRSRSKHEGESSASVCDRLSRTRISSQRQLPTDHDYAVPTREYQLDQSSPLPATAANLVLEKTNTKTIPSIRKC